MSGLRYAIFGLLALGAMLAASAVRVVTTTSDLAAIAREVGGDRVQVTSLADPSQDLHRIEPRPSFVTEISRADMVVRIGMDLDTWLNGLLDAARNGKVRDGGAGYVDASAGITPLEVPQGKVDGAQGDIHVYGNPHYWLDPQNGKVIAYNILVGLCRVDAAGTDAYKANYDGFAKAIDTHMEGWSKQMAPLNGTKVVPYHTTWSYFYNRFGLVPAGSVEPKPGIPPSGAYLTKLVNNMKHNNVKIVMTTVYYPGRYADVLRDQAGATVLVLPSSVGGSPAAKDYFGLFDATIAALCGAK
jgi:zinc/manganese transport system substrate-binding protein